MEKEMIAKQMQEETERKVQEFKDNVQRQNEHKLYLNAEEGFMRTAAQQNIKAALKYPEPLNPDNWTVEALVQHIRGELVDANRYAEALQEKERRRVMEPIPETPENQNGRTYYLMLGSIAGILKARVTAEKKVERIEEIFREGGYSEKS